MLRVTIEMLPGGDESKARVMHRGFITNDGSGTKQIGNYKVLLLDKAGRKWRTGALMGFPRTAQGAWMLLVNCLACALYNDMKPLADDAARTQQAAEADNG